MDNWVSFNSEHYVFYAHSGSYAETHFLEIACIQERCFSEICTRTGVVFAKRIRYYLCDSREEIGILTSGTPCNACTYDYDLIYAVYNHSVQCIGYHEDAHLISYAIAIPDSIFLREGFAMMFDGMWHGNKNTDIIANIGKQSISNLFDNDYFYALSDDITYPLAGAFTEFLVERYGMENYLNFYRAPDNPESAFGASIQALENEFYNQLK